MLYLQKRNLGSYNLSVSKKIRWYSCNTLCKNYKQCESWLFLNNNIILNGVMNKSWVFIVYRHSEKYQVFYIVIKG